MNWGVKIVTGMIVFMLFIISMVVYMFVVHGRDALIAEDYYEKGVDYNKEFNASQNTLTAKATPQISITTKQLIVKMKDSASYKLVLMRAANSKDDLKFVGNTVGQANLILINRPNLPAGLWFLQLHWQVNGKDFMFKESIKL